MTRLWNDENVMNAVEFMLTMEHLCIKKAQEVFIASMDPHQPTHVSPSLVGLLANRYPSPDKHDFLVNYLELLNQSSTKVPYQHLEIPLNALILMKEPDLQVVKLLRSVAANSNLDACKDDIYVLLYYQYLSIKVKPVLLKLIFDFYFPPASIFAKLKATEPDVFIVSI